VQKNHNQTSCYTYLGCLFDYSWLTGAVPYAIRILVFRLLYIGSKEQIMLLQAMQCLSVSVMLGLILVNN